MTVNSPIKVSKNYDVTAWKWMRCSAFLLIPLVWVHSIIQALLTGGHNLSLDYVALRWSYTGWRVYDFLLLAFAFAHGVNGLRQVLFDFVKTSKGRQALSWGMLLFWLGLSVIGAIAIIGGVKVPAR